MVSEAKWMPPPKRGPVVALPRWGSLYLTPPGPLCVANRPIAAVCAVHCQKGAVLSNPCAMKQATLQAPHGWRPSEDVHCVHHRLGLGRYLDVRVRTGGGRLGMPSPPHPL